MLEKIQTFFKEHKKACLMTFAVLLLFVGFSVSSAMNVQNIRNAANTSTDDTQTEQELENNSNVAEVTVKPSNDKAELTDNQKQLIDNYTQTEKDLIGVLKASVWSAGGSDYTLRFYDDYYIDTASGSAKQHTYAVSHIEKSNNTSANGVTEQTIVIETDDGSHIVKYQANTTSRLYAISSADAFSKQNTTYERSERTQDVKINGLNDEIIGLLGSDMTKITQYISDYCSLYLPTVSAVTWDNTATIDYSTQTIKVNFKTNDNNSKKIQLVYDRQNKSYSAS